MQKAKKFYNELKKEYDDTKISLEYSDPLQLLISTILSAQCTDERVNKVTKDLFEKFKTAEDYAKADIEDIKEIIRPTGFYNSKAKYIKESTKKIVKEHMGKVPKTMDELTALPGVARKTANIVLSNAFGINKGIAVDTHVKRITYRLGLTENKNPVRIEQDLMKQLPKKLWNKFTYVIIKHGRAICKAPTPICSECFLNKKCPKKGVKKSK